MKKITILLAYLFALLLSAGCQKQAGVPAGLSQSRATATAGKEDKTSFPAFLVGTWKADAESWEVTFGQDGSIESFRNYWNVLMKPEEGGTTERGPEGAYALYGLGPCSATYNPDTRELNVVLTLDYFEIKIQDVTFAGNSRDELLGSVSADGTTWNAGWFNYGELVDADVPDPRDITPQALVFEKVKRK
jgi:hypothetical protein